MVNGDGLYQVTTTYLCAGFVVENGRLAECAPVLRKNISYWMMVAKRIDNGTKIHTCLWKPERAVNDIG